MKFKDMFIIQLLLIIFLVAITLLFIVLFILKNITYSLNKKARKIFSSERTYDDHKHTINDFYKNKKIRPDEGEYVEFEEIKP